MRRTLFALLVILVSVAASADWPGTPSVTVVDLNGVAPTSCTTTGDTIIDSDSGLAWVCTSALLDTFRNAGGRQSLNFTAVNVARATHFDGTFCLGYDVVNGGPGTCATVSANADRAYRTPHNIFIGTCWAYVYGVTGTWNDGTDSISFDWRMNRLSPATSTDVTPALVVTSDLTWTSVSVNAVDPYADEAPTTSFIDLRPNMTSITDADASVTDVDIVVTCDMTEWD